MTQSRSANVVAAYEMLLEEVEAEIDRLNKAGGSAFVAGHHARAQELLARVEELARLRADLSAWGGRLGTLLGEVQPAAQREVHEGGAVRGAGAALVAARRGPARAAGRRTPEEAYRLPILSVLVEMGGGGETRVVLDRVYHLVKDQLSDHDRALPNSRSKEPRWRNCAAWCRNTLREEGLLMDNSPRGRWEISEEGRRWLAAQRRANQA